MVSFKSKMTSVLIVNSFCRDIPEMIAKHFKKNFYLHHIGEKGTRGRIHTAHLCLCPLESVDVVFSLKRGPNLASFGVCTFNVPSISSPTVHTWQGSIILKNVTHKTFECCVQLARQDHANCSNPAASQLSSLFGLVRLTETLLVHLSR